MLPAGPRLEDVYQSLILEHSRHPRHFGVLDGIVQTARGDNPFCGDAFTVSVRVTDDRIVAVAFDGAGCAISTASASMMAVGAHGLTRPQTEALYRNFERLLAGAPADELKLGDLEAFAAVSRLPVRVKCARLPWSILLAALHDGGPQISTE